MRKFILFIIILQILLQGVYMEESEEEYEEDDDEDSDEEDQPHLGGNVADVTKPAVPNVTNPPTASVTNPAVPNVTNPPTASVTNPAVPNVTNPPTASVTNPAVPNVTNPPVANVTKPGAVNVTNLGAANVTNPVLTGNGTMPNMTLPTISTNSTLNNQTVANVTKPEQPVDTKHHKWTNIETSSLISKYSELQFGIWQSDEKYADIIQKLVDLKKEMNLKILVMSNTTSNSSVFVQNALRTRIRLFVEEMSERINHVYLNWVGKKAPEHFTIRSHLTELQNPLTYGGAEKLLKPVIFWASDLSSYNTIINPADIKSVTSLWTTYGRLLYFGKNSIYAEELEKNFKEGLSKTITFMFDAAQITEVFIKYAGENEFATLNSTLWTNYVLFSDSFLDDQRSLAYFDNKFFLNVFNDELQKLVKFTKTFVDPKVTDPYSALTRLLNTFLYNVQQAATNLVAHLKYYVPYVESDKTAIVRWYFKAFQAYANLEFLKLEFKDNTVFKDFYDNCTEHFRKYAVRSHTQTMRTLHTFSKVGHNLTEIVNSAIDLVETCSNSENRATCVRRITPAMNSLIAKITTVLINAKTKYTESNTKTSTGLRANSTKLYNNCVSKLTTFNPVLVRY